MALLTILAAFGALAIAGALAGCGTGAAEESNSAAPAFPKGSEDGALPGDTLVPPAPEWTPRTYAIEPVPPERRRLTGAAGSLDELLRSVETALAERDTQRLLDLMITEREFREVFFPALPAAHPPIDASFETVWVNHYPDAYRGLQSALRRFGGRDVRIGAVRFDRPNQNFENFVLHEGSDVDLVLGEASRPGVPLLGSLFVVDGLWKVLSYREDGS